MAPFSTEKIFTKNSPFCLRLRANSQLNVVSFSTVYRTIHSLTAFGPGQNGANIKDCFRLKKRHFVFFCKNKVCSQNSEAMSGSNDCRTDLFYRSCFLAHFNYNQKTACFYRHFSLEQYF